jgi:hypothetical protein
MLVGLIAVALARGPIEALAEKYHVEIIVLMSQRHWQWAGYTVDMGKPDPAKLKTYEQLFAKEWSKYPDDLVQRANVTQIYIGQGLTMNGQHRGSVPAFDGNAMYYDVAVGDYNKHYQKIVVHHEFFHMLDYRMHNLYRDREWVALSPAGFEYGDGGAKMTTPGVGELTDKIPGFLTMYGTSGQEEDKAELFAHLIIDADYVARRATVDPSVAAKVVLIKQRLKAFDPGFDDRFWKQLPAG